MKKVFLLFFASLLFISCSDEFGIKSMNSSLYLLLPTTDQIKGTSIADFVSTTRVYSHKMLITEDLLDFDYLRQSSYFENTDFHHTFMSSINTSVIDFVEFSEESPESRKNYVNSFTFSITGTVNNEVKSERFIKQIYIDYLEEDESLYCIEFQFETENFGTIKALYTYRFARYI